MTKYSLSQECKVYLILENQCNSPYFWNKKRKKEITNTEKAFDKAQRILSLLKIEETFFNLIKGIYYDLIFILNIII